MSTLYLDRTWDLCLDANGSIAMAQEPYSLAQDAATAIRTFLTDCWYDQTIGIPYWGSILGEVPPIPFIKAQFEAAAMTVPGIVAAKVFISGVKSRTVTGQIQVTNKAGVLSVANF